MSRHLALDIIRDEHAALAAMLACATGVTAPSAPARSRSAVPSNRRSSRISAGGSDLRRILAIRLLAPVSAAAPSTPLHQSPGSPILGVEGLEYRMGGCCCPLPGEPIMGSVALGNHGITIHR